MPTITERRSSDGAVRYRATVRLKGYPPRSKTFAKKTEARMWAAQIELELRSGHVSAEDLAQPRTVAEAIDRYIKYILPRNCATMVKDQTRQLNWWKKELGSIPLNKLTRGVISEVRDKLVREPITPRGNTGKGVTGRPRYRRPATINRFVAALSVVLSHAARDWEWMAENPVTRMRKVRENNEDRGHCLTDEERLRLLEVCKKSGSSKLYLLVIFLLATGARTGEVLGLRWENLDLENGRASLKRTKNGQPRTLFLSGQLVEMLGGLREQAKPRQADLIFPGHVDLAKPLDLKRPWDDARKLAGLPTFRLHDLRHSCATYLAQTGATEHEIMKLLGHKTPQMAQRYVHLAEEHARNALDRMHAQKLKDAA